MTRVSALLLASMFMLACSTGVSPKTATSSSCDTASLEMALAGGGVAAGTVRAYIELRNISGGECEVFGYLKLDLLDLEGRPVPARIEQSSNDLSLQTPAPFAAVALPVHGRAYAPLRWYDAAEPCVTVYKLRITPPGSTGAAVIRVGPDAFANVVICSGGLVTMNPVRAAPY